MQYKLWTMAGILAVALLIMTQKALALGLKETQAVTIASRYIKTADLTGDGAADLVGVRANKLATVVNNGSGNLSEKSSFALAGMSLFDLELGDVNGDNQPEAVTLEEGQSKIFIYDINKEGTITGAPRTIAFGEVPTSVTLADFDNDKDLDLAVTKRATQEAVIYRNDGRGAFTAKTGVNTGGVNIVTSDGVTAGDVNGDGYRDLIVGGYTSDGAFTVMFSDNNAVLTTSSMSRGIQIPGEVVAVVSSDFSGDRSDDVVTANARGGYSMSVFRFKDNRVRSVNEIPCPGGLGGPLGLSLGDVTGDRIQDVIGYSCEAAEFSATLLTGTGTIVSPLSTPVRLFATKDPSSSSAAIADFNRDGLGDIVMDSRLFLQQPAPVEKPEPPKTEGEKTTQTVTTTVSVPTAPPPPAAALKLKLLTHSGQRKALAAGRKKQLSVTYSVSLDSTLDVKLNLLKGGKPAKTVATLRKQVSVGDGVVTLRPATLAVGTYRLELTATSSDNQKQMIYATLKVRKAKAQRKQL